MKKNNPTQNVGPGFPCSILLANVGLKTWVCRKVRLDRGERKVREALHQCVLSTSLRFRSTAETNGEVQRRRDEANPTTSPCGWAGRKNVRQKREEKTCLPSRRASVSCRQQIPARFRVCQGSSSPAAWLDGCHQSAPPSSWEGPEDRRRS